MSGEKRESEIDAQLLRDEYQVIRPLAERFCEEIASQLDKLLNDSDIALGFPIQRRVKPWESLAEKLERVPMNITHIQDIQDLVGLRIVILFRQDVAKVSDLVSNHFALIRRYDTQERLKEDQFGYSSVHFVVKLPDEWLAVPTLSQMGDLKAEIQIRTLAQHTWAEVSHTLQYKREDSVPPPLRRAIYRVSALLEMIDLEFDRVLVERESYRRSIDVSGTGEELNVDLLEKTLDDLLPEKNKDDDEPYSELLEDLVRRSITEQQELKSLIQKHIDKVLAKDSVLAQSELRLLKQGSSVLHPERTKRGVFFTHVGLVREALSLELGASSGKHPSPQ